VGVNFGVSIGSKIKHHRFQSPPVRIEGQPAKTPSFWIKGVHFVHTYAKQGPLPSTRALSTT
jgi:hypothetical protein